MLRNHDLIQGLTQPQKRIYELLLTPIICENKADKIGMHDGKIHTGQKYKNTADEDMSDFAVGFYEIIYKGILTNQKMLHKDGGFIARDFAGDTMNSFNSIANRVPGAGKYKRVRTPYQEWPEYLQNYFYQYHCLANFWVLPMALGRTSMKLNDYDSTDLFLNMIEKNYKQEMTAFRDYRIKVPTFDYFCKVHFIHSGRNTKEIEQLYEGNEKAGETLISYANKDMQDRAYRIATSKYENELYNYFENLNLI